MQSIIPSTGHSNISVSELREPLQLETRPPLDRSWNRAAPDTAHPRAYPSPPMSGSSPRPPSHNPDSGDINYGGYGSTAQDMYRGNQTPQSEHSDQSLASMRPYSQEMHQPHSYSSLPSMADGTPTPYQQQRAHGAAERHPYASHPEPPATGYSTSDRPAISDGSGYPSPKAQRKTKGHVASACVPCKRAHLRCDAQRPCSRCQSNGKEDTCVDVQHKKRGRPRLRDEREPRYDGLSYPPGPPDGVMRRPLSLYSVNENPAYADGPGSAPYRVLKSQGGGPVAPRYFDQTSPADAGGYSAGLSSTRLPSGREPALAYLTMELQVAKSTPAFGQALGGQSVNAVAFHDLVSPSDRDKVFRLQKMFEDERRDREPNYLPPIYLKFEEDRVIQSVGFAAEDISQFRTDRSEVFTFQGPDGQQRTFQVHYGLEKRESTYFVVFILHVPASAQAYHQPPPPPFPRDQYSREPQYGYQSSQHAYSQAPGISSYMSTPSYPDHRGEALAYRAPPTLGSNAPPPTTAPSLAHSQVPPRTEYIQSQTSYQPLRNDTTSTQAPLQHDLQLPPIRDQRGEESELSRRRDDRAGRVDIGGLLEKPDSTARR